MMPWQWERYHCEDRVCVFKVIEGGCTQRESLKPGYIPTPSTPLKIPERSLPPWQDTFISTPILIYNLLCVSVSRGWGGGRGFQFRIRIIGFPHLAHWSNWKTEASSDKSIHLLSSLVKMTGGALAAFFLQPNETHWSCCHSGRRVCLPWMRPKCDSPFFSCPRAAVFLLSLFELIC